MRKSKNLNKKSTKNKSKNTIKNKNKKPVLFLVRVNRVNYFDFND